MISYGILMMMKMNERTWQTQSDAALTLRLPYTPPFDWQGLLRFLAGRAIQGVELVVDGVYLRTVQIWGDDGVKHTGWLQVRHIPGEDALQLQISPGLLPVLPMISSRIRQQFDLDCDPAALAQTLQRMDGLRPGLFVPGIRLPGCFEPFETATRAVLGQQITVKAASTLAGRLTRAFGEQIHTGIEGLSHAFPTAQRILALGENVQDALGSLGIIGTRALCIAAVAQGLGSGELDLQNGSDPQKAMRVLLGIRGIGPWTAQYIAMRTMGYADAFLETDAGVKMALPGMKGREMIVLAEPWRPYRSYAVMCLWRSLG